MPAKIVCQCASISPGMSVRPRQSMTVAPSGGESSFVPSALIRPSSTMRRNPPLSALALPSNSRKFEKTTGRSEFAACAAARGENPSAESDAPMPAIKPRRDMSRSMRIDIDRSAEEQHAQPTWAFGLAISPASSQENMRASRQAAAGWRS